MGEMQFVTFVVDRHLMGIDVLQVQEINQVLDFTPVQRAPEYVLGLVNLRGQTVTVFDLAVRLGITAEKETGEGYNIVLKHDHVGLLVDAIGDVVKTGEADIEPPPANVGDIEMRFIRGVVKLPEQLLVILAAEKILEYRDD